MESKQTDVSVIVPVKDEAANIEALAQEISEAMSARPWSWECIWIDDGSLDGTRKILKRLTSSDARHRYCSFSRSLGQSAALWMGFSEARGEILATIDGDGQNDPADIPVLVEMVLSDRVDMANGYRSERRDGFVRRAASRTANRFRNLVTGKTVRDVGCSTRAFRRECVQNIPEFAGMHRFLPTLVAMRGFRICEAPVAHRPRLKGASKYTINNRLWVGIVDTFGVLWLRNRAFQIQSLRTKDH